MASFDVIAHPYLRPADAIRQQSDLGDQAYESYSGNGIQAYGRQATFDILNLSQDGRGLRVKILRSHAAAEASNGYSVSVTVGNSLAVSVTASNKAITIGLLAATTMAQLKTRVDANSNLSSVYFGGETGTGPTDAQEVADTDSGVEDQWAAVRYVVTGDVFISIGTAAPSNDNVARIMRSNTLNNFRIPPGQLAWIKRVGGADVRGSVEIWRPAGTEL